MKDTISIIITAYNAEETIGRAITSILEQTFAKNIDLIIVDDCSSDNTCEVVKKYLSNNVRLFKNTENYGTYPSRNLALRHVRGDFITFVDADDWIDKHHIEYLYKSFKYQYNKDIWKGTKYESRRNKFKIAFSGLKEHKFLEGKIKLIGEKTLQGFDRKTGRRCFASLFMHRNLLLEFGGFDSVRFGADSEFIERVESIYGPQMSMIPPLMITYNVLQRDESLTRSDETGLKSNTRINYALCFRRFHKQVKILMTTLNPSFDNVIQNLIYFNFPQKVRPFKITLNKDNICSAPKDFFTTEILAEDI